MADQQKHEAAANAILDRINAEIAETASGELIRDLAEAYSLLTGGASPRGARLGF